MKPPIIISVILIPLGAGILYLGIKGILNTRTFLRNAVETKGEVIEIEENISTNSDNETSIFYYPIVRFRDTKNKAVTFKSKIGRGSPNSFKRGQALTILYDRQQPNSAKIKSFTEIWMGTLILMGLGTAIIILGTYYIVLSLLTL